MVQVRAGFRGMNEFTDVRWLYDAVMKPPDPRLIPIGPTEPLPIRKTAGAPTGGLMTFMHRGEGGLFVWATASRQPGSPDTAGHSNTSLGPRSRCPPTLCPRPLLWTSCPPPGLRQRLFLQGDRTP